MNAIGLSLKLSELDVDIRLADAGELELKINAPAGVLNDELISEIKENKDELIQFLKNEKKRRRFSAIPTATKKEYYAMSSVQRRLYALQGLDPQSRAYNMPRVIRLPGAPSRDRLELAFKELIRRHESLRTAFVLKDEEPFQYIHDQVDFEIEYHSAGDEVPQEQIIECFIRPFDLTRAPLLRVGLIEVNDEYTLLVDMHHIISDGTSHQILRQEFDHLYSCHELDAVGMQYKDYSEWQSSDIQQEKSSEQKSFWLNRLSGELPVLDLPADFSRPCFQSFTGNSAGFMLTDAETGVLKDIAQQTGATLFMVTLAVYNIWLSKLTSQEDIIVGTPIAARRHDQLQRVIGMFANTLALRNFPRADSSFPEFLDSVKTSTLEAFENQEYQFEELVHALAIDRDVSRNPLFDTVFNMVNQAGPGNYQLDLSANGTYIHKKGISKFDLTLTAVDFGKAIYFSLEYCSKLFKPDTINRYIGYFRKTISQLGENIHARLANIQIISPDERERVLVEFNDTRAPFPANTRIHQFFEEQVKQDPQRTALIEGQIGPEDQRKLSISYGRLDQYANRLANMLQDRGVTAGGIVGIMTRSSIAMIAGILAVLKTGCAYLPLDPDYPTDRKQYILGDCNTRFVLTDIPGHHDYIAQPLPLADSVIDSYSAEYSSKNSENSLAYIMYTSGSTGRPKGVMVEHRNVTRLVKNTNYVRFKEGDRILPTGALEFDASTFEIWGALLNGLTLVLVPQESLLDPACLKLAVRDNHITTMWMTAPLFNQMLDADIEIFEGLQNLLVGGDVLSPSHINRLIERFPEMNVINGYGPTENTTFSLTFDIRETYEKNIPIGKPINNSTAFILDKSFNPVPPGIPGELYVGGQGVARGYLNNPELTYKKFLPLSMIDSFDENGTIYATGDLARWLPSGDMEFLGRKDDQVKIRGFRVELGEIEARLMNHDNIKEAVVLARDDGSGNKYICAYIVTNHPLEISTIKQHLSEHLPAYMIPSYFTQLDKLPLNANGKVDKLALPDPADGISGRDSYLAPRNPLEEKLASIWAGVLGVDKIGIKDSFFDLGGDSIKAIQMQARMSTCGYSVDVRELFLNPTIIELSQKLKERKKEVSQAVVTGNIPLTPIQRDFLRQETGRNHFNQSVLLFSKQRLEEDAIRHIFSRIQDHHDTLRITFQFDGEQVIQYNHPNGYPLSLDVIDLSTSDQPQQELLDRCNTLQSSIDLSKGPLMKLGLFHMIDGDRLLIVIHHLVVDGVSWRVLFEDIEHLWQQYTSGTEESLPLKTDSFKNWAEQLQDYAASEKLLNETDYWRTFDSSRSQTIPRDFENPYYLKDGDKKTFTLSLEDTQLLLRKVNDAYNTDINDILLTALGQAVKQTFGCNRVAVTLEGHGRENISQDIDVTRTVGWFTSAFPVMLDMTRSHDISRQIKEIKEHLHQVPNKGIGYGILRYITPAELKTELDLDVQPRLNFNYLGQFDSDVKNMSQFEIAPESSGQPMSLDRQSFHDLSITGITAENRLSIAVSYSTGQYKPETIERFINDYRDELIQLIQHCTNQKTKQFTPSDFSYKKLSIQDVEQLTGQYEIEDIYPLSPMQEGMLFHSLEDQSSQAYLEQVCYRFEGDLEPVLVEKTLNMLLKRYDIFRTLFLSDNNKYERYLQIVLKERTIDFRYEDLRNKNSDDTEQWIENYKISDRKNTFILHEDVLMRVAVFRLSEREYQVIWTFHHILMDGWCLGIINKEFFEIYRSLVEGNDLSLPPVAPYKTYIHWLETREKDNSRRYWRDYLSAYQEQASLPKVVSEARDYKYKNEELVLSFDKQKTADLNKWAAENKVTLNTVIKAVWSVLLSRYSGKDDVVFGTVVSGRPYQVPGVETIVGLFINSIPVRMRVDDELRFCDLVKSTQMDYIDGEPHHYMSLAEIQAETSLNHQLLDHLFVFENYPMERGVAELAQAGQHTGPTKKGALKLSDVEAFEQTNYDLNILLREGENLSIRFRFNANVYDRDYISRLGVHLENVIAQVLDNSDVLISDINYISPAEISQFLDEFNHTRTSYPHQKTLHRLFEEQAEKTPDAIALVGVTGRIHQTGSSLDDNSWLLPDFAAQVSLTYKQVNQKANQLARLLRSKNIKPDTLVGILGRRSPELIIGVLAILKAGGAYLPVDPDYPKDRIYFMLNDGNVNVLLTQKETIADYRANFDTIDLGDPGIYHGPVENLEHVNSFSDLVYVIYTSGSTGRPKGIMAEHRNAVRLVKNTNFYSFAPGHRILQTGALEFDASTFEIWGALLNGLTLYLYDKERITNPADLHKLLKVNNITTMWLTSSLFNQMLDANIEMFSGLSSLLIGGEALCPVHITRLRYRFGDLDVINGYGPTENVTFSTTFKIDMDVGNNIPIGKPIANSTAYIIDEKMHLVNIGVTGELVVGGDGVARGYMNNSGLTNQSFIDNPFVPGEKMYKTGDLARWLPDGNIQFLGRIDTQVKLRGFRIELGEIENRLLAVDTIKDAVVVAKEDARKEKYLCAYIVIDDEKDSGSLPIDISQIKKQLSENLPDYMIPARCVTLEKLPLTSNGKVDRRVLPEPEIQVGEDHIAPRNELEEKLVDIWADVLNLKPEVISVASDFFELGGHSLHATKLLYKIHQELNIKIQLVDMFRTPTVEGLASLIEAGETETLANFQESAPEDIDIEEMIL